MFPINEINHKNKNKSKKLCIKIRFLPILMTDIFNLSIKMLEEKGEKKPNLCNLMSKHQYSLYFILISLQFRPHTWENHERI